MLTAKREQFCLEMIKPKANRSKAYRASFNTKGDEGFDGVKMSEGGEQAVETSYTDEQRCWCNSSPKPQAYSGSK